MFVFVVSISSKGRKMIYREKDESRVISVSNTAKFRSRRKPANYDRPGREYKAERKYRRGAEHFGKGPTLRTHRGKPLKQVIEFE